MSDIFFLQVINIINAAQESSPMPVAEALDRVLEILRTTELYSPQLGTKDEDPHTNDLVGGLMTVSSTSFSTRVLREVRNTQAASFRCEWINSHMIRHVRVFAEFHVDNTHVYMIVCEVLTLKASDCVQETVSQECWWVDFCQDFCSYSWEQEGEINRQRW